MLRVYRAELRDSWPAWLSVSLTFVVANFTLALLALTAFSGFDAVEASLLDVESSALYTIVPAFLAVTVCFVIGPVVSSATSLVVDARRGALARLALAGATPRQVRSSVLTQLSVVLACSALVGDAVALLLVQPYLNLLMSDTVERNPGMYVAPIVASYEVQPLLLSTLLCLGVALLGARRRAGEAAKIPPVEALRQSAALAPGQRRRVGRVIAAVLVGLVIAGMAASLPVQAANRYKETVSNIMMEAFFLMFLIGGLLAIVAPFLVGPFTKAWTRLVPTTSAPWLLARSTVTARSDRLFKSVVPVMFTVGIAVTEVAMGATVGATMEAAGAGDIANDSTLANLVLVFGMPLGVALAGGVGVLLMMGRQRDADLALAGIAGATPAQRVLLPTFEALMIVGTSLLMSLAMAVGSLGFMGIGFALCGLDFRVSAPPFVLVVTIAACTAITLAATVLPTLRAGRLPEPRVVARLVAD